jgi:hypothetical protein
MNATSAVQRYSPMCTDVMSWSCVVSNLTNPPFGFDEHAGLCSCGLLRLFLCVWLFLSICRSVFMLTFVVKACMVVVVVVFVFVFVFCFVFYHNENSDHRCTMSVTAMMSRPPFLCIFIAGWSATTWKNLSYFSYDPSCVMCDV